MILFEATKIPITVVFTGVVYHFLALRDAAKQNKLRNTGPYHTPYGLDFSRQQQE